MEGNWYLYSDIIKAKCESFKTILSTDIENQENALTQLKKIVDENRLKGQALETFRNQLTDYYATMELCKSADEKDIADCNTLMGAADETFDGDFISLMYNNAKKNRDIYRAKAIAEWALAAAFVTTAYSFNPILGIWVAYEIANPHISTAQYYDSTADSYQQDMDKWQAKRDKYDKINSDTASLFTAGKEIRTSADSLLAEMNKHSIAGTYNSNISTTFLGELDSLSEGFKVLKKITHDKDFYKLSMENFKNDHPEYADMVDLQADIFYLEEQIENCPNGTAKSEMIKQLAILRNRMDSLFMQNACVFDADGNVIGNRLESLYNSNDLDVISFLVDIYETNHPTAQANMNHLLHDNNVTNQLDSPYYQDFVNIKFITYTSPEPERSIIIEYASVIKVNTFDENGIQHWDPSKEELHLDLDGYNGINKGMLDNGAPYRSVFHEIGHAIDDLSIPDKASLYNVDIWGDGNLSYQLDANGKSLQDYTRQDVENNLRISISTACYDTRNYNMSMEDRAVLLDYIMGGHNRGVTLSPSQQAVFNHLYYYYDHSNPVIAGTKYTYKTYGNITANETFNDVFQGYTDNVFGFGGHPQANYWYTTSGDPTYKQSLEFFAETFSERITYSPYGQFDATCDFFPSGVSRYETMILELSN